jgi:predicted GNAT family acetyltransferase
VIIRDPSPSVFLKEAGPLLYEREAENALALGLATGVLTGPPISTLDFTPLFLRAVNSDRRTTMAYVQTRKLNGVLSSGDPLSASDLAHYVRLNDFPIDGIVGPEKPSTRFAREYCQTANMTLQESLTTNMMELEQVIWPPTALGEMMFLQPHQADQAVDWTLAFQDEAIPNEKQTVFQIRKIIDARISAKSLFGWVNLSQGLVTMASISRETRNSFAISLVYTPPEFRGRGLASNLVAKLSQYLLDRGKRYVFLNADVRNSTSNKIYQKIGFRNVGLLVSINFEPST